MISPMISPMTPTYGTPEVKSSTSSGANLAACWLPAPALKDVSGKRPVADAAMPPLKVGRTIKAEADACRAREEVRVASSDAEIARALRISPRRLRIHMTSDVTTTGILALTASTGNRALRQLELWWDLAAPCEVDAGSIGRLASLGLETIHFECCVHADLTAAVIAFARCETLRDLAVVECDADAEECMAALAECANLRRLEWRCHATDVAVWELVQGGSSLEHLSVSAYEETGLTHDACLAVASCCPNLRSLSLAGVVGLGDQSTLAIAGKLDGVAGCPKLRRLELGCEEVLSAVTDASIGTLADGALPALEALNVCGCPLISADALASLARRRPKLTVLAEDATEGDTSSPEGSC